MTDIPYSRKFSRDPIFAEGHYAKISRSNYRGWTFRTAPPTNPVWLRLLIMRCHLSSNGCKRSSRFVSYSPKLLGIKSVSLQPIRSLQHVFRSEVLVQEKTSPVSITRFTSPFADSKMTMAHSLTEGHVDREASLYR